MKVGGVILCYISVVFILLNGVIGTSIFPSSLMDYMGFIEVFVCNCNNTIATGIAINGLSALFPIHYC